MSSAQLQSKVSISLLVGGKLKRPSAKSVFKIRKSSRAEFLYHVIKAEQTVAELFAELFSLAVSCLSRFATLI